MWPFNKTKSLPGYKYNTKGDLVFELTDEEEQAIQKQFDSFKRPDKVFAVRNEIAEEFNESITALGLFAYAQHQISISDFDSNKNDKTAIINKAIASISKAYKFCQLPIFMYDLACFMKMNGNFKEAKDFSKKFLELQFNFKPSEVQGVLLSTLSRDIEYSTKHAEQMIKEL